MVNGENDVRGVNYKKSSSHFRSNVSWSDYMKPFEKFF